MNDDMWEYDTVANTWKWLYGSGAINTKAVFPATQNSPCSTCTPGGRSSITSWYSITLLNTENNNRIDSNDNFYIFGGTNSSSSPSTSFSDLWMYSSGTWTWLSGVKVKSLFSQQKSNLKDCRN